MAITEVHEPGETRDSDDAFETLVNEHRVLLRLADSLEIYAAALSIGTADPQDLIKFCVFFREFGAMIHHEKEERIAVAALSLHGYQPGGAPRAQLHEEHEHEHAQLLHIIRYSLSVGSWQDKDRERISSLLAGYAAQLRLHLRAEEEMLYPRLRATLTQAELASVGRKLRRFDEMHNTSGQLTWLLELGHELTQKYPGH